MTDQPWKPPPWWARQVARVSGRIERLLSRIERLSHTYPEDSLAGAKQAFEWAIQHWGPDSRQAVVGHRKLAERLESMDQFEEALLHRRRVVESVREHLGPEDPSTVEAESWLALNLTRQERNAEALPLLEHVVEARSRDLGPDDRSTLLAMEWLGCAELTLGHPEEAQSLLDRAVSAYDLTGRGESEDCMITSAHLARALDALDEHALVIQIRRHILAIRTQTLGPTDIRTLKSLRNLCITLFNNDEVSEAKVLAQELVAARIQTGGIEDPDTVAAKDLLALIEEEEA